MKPTSDLIRAGKMGSNVTRDSMYVLRTLPLLHFCLIENASVYAPPSAMTCVRAASNAEVR